jgi:phosphoribosyl-ATP pyrophosphohydrolase/phosphoribosyl-AMP cyclohydrolase
MKAIKYDEKTGLAPAIIQDINTGQVLMLGYMNAESFKKTLDSGLVTFYSRSRQELWTKGETSGNYLHFVSYATDCDGDALLVKAKPDGPTCHTGSYTCWEEPKNEDISSLAFLKKLESVIKQRRTQSPETSYTAKLFAKGINKIAQKVGEEAVEVVIEAKDDNDDLFLNEAADLVFHFMVLLEAKNKGLDDVVNVLKGRSK